MTPVDYEFLRKFLKERSGLDLSPDKQYLVESRLIPLARRVGLSGIGELVLKLRGGTDPLTGYFRDGCCNTAALPPHIFASNVCRHVR